METKKEARSRRAPQDAHPHRASSARRGSWCSRSNLHIYAQIIAPDGRQGARQRVDARGRRAQGPARTAATRPRRQLVGKRIAEKAKALGIEAVAFDRSGFRFHGRVKALADAAREGGLKF